MTNAGSIHEKAVAMIQSALYGRYEARVRAPGVGQNPVYVRLHPSPEEFSGNIAEGAVKVKVPGEWDSVGGVIPDLILYKADDTPVRIIEVIDTSAPTEAKREKLDRLVRRGVDVVEIEVHTTDDLLHLLKRPPALPFWHNLPSVGGPGSPRSNQQVHQETEAHRYEGAAKDLLNTLTRCTPYQRQCLAAVLADLASLDSLFPTPTPAKEQEGDG